MGNLSLHTGPQGSYYFFKDKIFHHLSSGEEEVFLYLLPVNRAVRYFKKEMVLESPEQAILDLNIYTFSSFLLKIYNNLPQYKKIITPAMRLILLREILRKNQEEMDYFQAQWALGKGMLIKTDRMVEEFFQFGYRPDDFNLPPVSAEKKYKDFGHLITSLYTQYNDNLIDESSLINAIVNQLDLRSVRDMYPRLQKIYISGFGIYSPPMIEFLRVMKESYTIEIKLEYDQNNDELFQHTANAFEALSVLSDQRIHHPEDDTGIASTLFKHVNEDFQKENLPKQLVVQEAVTRTEEIRLIASKIKSLEKIDHVRLSKIGITFPEIETYGPLIKKVFREFDIPFNLSTGFPLAESPLIQSYLQVLRLASYGNSLEDVYKLALSPFLNEDLVDNAQFVFQMASKCNIRYLSGDWQNKIMKLFSKTSKEIVSLGGFGRIPVDEVRERLSRMESFCDKIQPLSRSRPIAELHKFYLETLESLGLLKWFQPTNEALSVQEQEKEYRAFNRFRKLLDEIMWILNRIHGKSAIPVSEYYHYLSLIIENSTYNLREWSDYGVQIMPRLEILSLNLDHFFIGGLVEGEFPRIFTRDIFFNDDERLEMGLNASEDRLNQDRFLFYQWLSSDTQNITLSYPITEKDKTLQKSTFLTALNEVAGNIKYEDVPERGQVISDKSVLQYLSLSLREGLTPENMDIYQSWLSGSKERISVQWQNNIRALIKRRNHLEVTKFEGNLSQSAAVQDWIQSKHVHQPYSVTGLESYAFCPMQYFLQRILKLEKDEEPDTTINNLERGNALHKIFYTFYTGLSPTQKLRPWEHLDRLEKIASEIFMTLPYDDIIWAIEKEKYFGIDSAEGLWEKFLMVEKETIEASGFKPLYHEVKFGHFAGENRNDDSSKPLIIKRDNADIEIYGIVDRIDLDDEGRLIVIDYKTGTAATKINIAQIIEGLSLQLPIYLAAARLIPTENGQLPIPLAGLYYQVRDAENCKRVIVFADGDHCSDLPVPKKVQLPMTMKDDADQVLSFKDVLDGSLAHIVGYVEKMEGGNFQHTKDPTNDKCKSYCAYKRICRKDTAKLLSLK